MIQLATDPNASRPNWRGAAQADVRQDNPLARKGRSGHAWPFIAQPAERPIAAPAARRVPANHGS